MQTLVVQQQLESDFHLSVKSNLHLLWSCIPTLSDWLKKFATFLTNQKETKTNHDLLKQDFPRFV